MTKAAAWWQRLKRSRTRQEWLLFGGVVVCLGIFLFIATTLTPYRPPDQQASFYEARSSDQTSQYQRVRILQAPAGGKTQGELLDGNRTGEQVEVRVGTSGPGVSLKKGDVIFAIESLMDKANDRGSVSYVDRVRLNALAVLLALFVALVVFVSDRRGALSIAGLLLSILVIGWFIIPMIIKGHNAFLITLIGSYVIAIASVLVAHGRRRRTYIAIACILAVLTLVALLAWIATWLVSLTGIADETAFYLAIDNQALDMRGVVIGGIVIASLGALDDIVTTQVATVEELHRSDQKQSRAVLAKAASSVGNEHITSLVNTLALAYVGASLPFIIMMMSRSSVSPLITLNGEYIATEITRTLVASIGLVVAVPLSTFVATMIYTRTTHRKVS